MSEPKRLRESGGPAAQLLSAAELEVPSGSRKRALAFTGAAATLLANSGAVAASGGALFKSVMLWVVVGTIGGGAVSFTVAETLSRIESRESSPPPRRATPPLPLPPPRAEVPLADAPAPVAPEAALDTPPAAAPTPPITGRSPAALRPSAAPPGAKAATPPVVKTLFDEQRSIEAARAAVARGDAATALSTLDEYRRDYPQGQFGPEALALRVEALRARGDHDAARAFARQFERRYPDHPLLARVRASAGR